MAKPEAFEHVRHAMARAAFAPPSSKHSNGFVFANARARQWAESCIDDAIRVALEMGWKFVPEDTQ